MKILWTYVIRLFLKAYFSFLAGVALIVMVVHLAELQKRSLGHTDISLVTKLQLAFLKMPYILEQVTPFLVFIAALFVFWRLNRQHELDVVRAVGVSIWRFVFPLSFFVLLFGGLELALFNPITSHMMTRHTKVEARTFKKNESGVKVSQSGIWLSEVNNGRQRIFNIKSIDLKSGLINRVTIFNFDSSHHFISRYDAQRARLVDKAFEIPEGWYLSLDGRSEKIQDVRLPTQITSGKIENTEAHRSKISFWYLPKYIELLKASGLYSLKYQVYYQMLLVRPLWYAGMILLAPAFMVYPVRSRYALSMLLAALVSGFFLYFMRDMSYALGAGGELPPAIAAWGVPIITLVAGFMLMLYQEDRS